MSYLLDVNSLVALGYRGHLFHERTSAWAEGMKLFTASISELGFVRVLIQLPEVDVSMQTCKQLLKVMKAERDIHLLEDGLGVADLPSWVKKPKQITDGHLLELARRNGSQLATLDQRIPGAFLIPR